MKLWVTRQNNGLYMLTYFKPDTEIIFGSEKKDVYIVKGEPIGVRNLCNKIMVLIDPENKMHLEKLQSVQVELSGKVIADLTED